MKHLSENYDILYTNDIIDYKEFNYLLDKLTKYEDESYCVNLVVCVRRLIDYYHYLGIYGYRDGIIDDEIFLDGSYPKYYRTDGLYYRIYMYKNEGQGDVYNKYFQNEFYNSVSSKFVKISTDGLLSKGIELILKSKR